MEVICLLFNAMESDVTTVRSSVQSTLIRRALIRGTILAGAGAILLALSGSLIPPGALWIWGLPIYITSIALIALGMLPYRQLKRLEMNPYALIQDDLWLRFSSKGELLFSIPLTSIAETKYIDDQYIYGIGVWLKKPLPQKIVVRDRHFDLEAFMKKSQKEHGCDLFFPYFTERSAIQLEVV